MRPTESVDLGISSSGILRSGVCRKPPSQGIPRRNCSALLILESGSFPSLFPLSLSRDPRPAHPPGLDPESTPGTCGKNVGKEERCLWMLGIKEAQNGVGFSWRNSQLKGPAPLFQVNPPWNPFSTPRTFPEPPTTRNPRIPHDPRVSGRDPKGHRIPAPLPRAAPEFPRLLPPLLPDFPEERPKRGGLLPSPGSRQIPGFGMLGRVLSLPFGIF